MNQFDGGGFVNLYLEIYVCKIKISSKNSQKPERNNCFSESMTHKCLNNRPITWQKFHIFDILNYCTSNPLTLLISAAEEQFAETSIARKIFLVKQS